MGDLDMRRLDELPLVFFDLETTGLDLAAGHRICEVAALRVYQQGEAGRLDTLVNPDRLLDPGAAAVNGLRDDLLHAAPPFATIAPALIGIFSEAVLVAHNLPFDLAFLHAELRALGRQLPLVPTLDTLALARRLLRLRSYSLAALAAEFDLPAPTHRAMDDVQALYGVFRHLQQHMADLGVTTLGAAQRLERGFLPGMAEPVVPPLIEQAISEGLLLRIRYRSRNDPHPTERAIRPLYVTNEHSGVHLRAFCTLRNDLRSFVLTKIELLELVAAPEVM
ncbi:MAG: WYL domain-containing protein [Oscillochloris sp.]|nr:WYL domain-containing protein [Oscillochloris sp.]